MTARHMPASDEMCRKDLGVAASPPLCGPSGGAAKASPAKPAAANAVLERRSRILGRIYDHELSYLAGRCTKAQFADNVLDTLATAELQP